MQQSKNITIYRSDFTNLKKQCLYVVLGKKRSGKTTAGIFLTQFIQATGNKRFRVFCGNSDNIEEWKNVLYEEFVEQLNINSLLLIRERQDKKIKTARNQFVANGGNSSEFIVPTKYRLCIIFDDCASNSKFMKNEVVSELCSNHRHYGLDIMFIAQYFNQIVPSCRDQIDYYLLLKIQSTKSLAKVHEEGVGDTLIDRNKWNKLYNHLIKKKGDFIWLDLYETKTEIHEVIFSGNIPYPLPKFKLTCPEIEEYISKRPPVVNNKNPDNEFANDYEIEEEEKDDKISFMDKGERIQINKISKAKND